MVKTRVRFAGGSDAGRQRRNNEDAWYADPDRGIFLVVDGLGGQNAGERAAEIAVERVRARLERQTGTTDERIREAIAMANNEIYRASHSNPEWAGMACVLTLVVIENGTAVAGHVGDSRLYKIRAGRIEKITHDHSPVGEREDRGEIGEAEAMQHPRRHEVFRDVGSEEHAPDDAGFIEVRRFAFEPDSALLLCSDGLSDQVSADVILRTVERHAHHPEQAVQELIDAANRAGGKDNVTVLAVAGEQFTAPPAAAEIPLRSRRWLSWTPAAILLALAGLAAAWFVPRFIKPKVVTVVIAPAVRAVGPGQTYTTIGSALVEAIPGDTVEVMGGEYREQVILKSGVEVRSRPGDEVVLKSAPTDLPAVLADNVKDARFSGFRILADRETPLSTGIVINNSAVEVDDTEIAGARVGIEIRGSANPVLRANSIHDCLAEGVVVIGPGSPRLSHNLIRRNKGAGLDVREGAQPVLVDNVIERNAPPGKKLK